MLTLPQTWPKIISRKISTKKMFHAIKCLKISSSLILLRWKKTALINFKCLASQSFTDFAGKIDSRNWLITKWVENDIRKLNLCHTFR